MEPTDITIEILRGIRDEVKQTNSRLDAMREELSGRIDSTNTRIDSTNTRLDSLRDELSHRIVASEVRTATAISDLTYATREMTDVLRAQHDLRPRVDRCEHDISALKQHLGLG